MENEKQENNYLKKDGGLERWLSKWVKCLRKHEDLNEFDPQNPRKNLDVGD